MPSAISLTIKNRTNEAFTYHGTSDSGRFLHSGSPNPTTISPGSEIVFVLNPPDANFHQAYGYAYFNLSSSEGSVWPKAFIVCANVMSDRIFSYIDAGWSDPLNLRPTLKPSNNPHHSDASSIFPFGKIGLSTLHPCNPNELPTTVSIEIHQNDLPLAFLNTGGGHDMWMTMILQHPQTKHTYASKPISALYIPGSHDTATWTASLDNAMCNSLSLYEQLKLGIRVFDLRLFPDTEGDTQRFQPYHGLLLRTAPAWNENLNDIGKSMSTILGQLDTWYQETAGSAEFAMLGLTLGGYVDKSSPTTTPDDDGFQPTQTQVDNFWKLMQFYFNDKALASPGADSSLPSLQSMHNSTRRIILSMNNKMNRRPSDATGAHVVAFYNDYVWGRNEGTRDGAAWNDKIYEQGQYESNQEKIIKFVEGFMVDNRSSLVKRDRLCGMPCQVTPKPPVLPFPPHWPVWPNTAPSDRLFAPEFNLRLQQALNTDLWLDCANIISGDYFDGPTVERIIAMHFKRT